MLVADEVTVWVAVLEDLELADKPDVFKLDVPTWPDVRLICCCWADGKKLVALSNLVKKAKVSVK